MGTEIKTMVQVELGKEQGAVLGPLGQLYLPQVSLTITKPWTLQVWHKQLKGFPVTLSFKTDLAFSIY